MKPYQIAVFIMVTMAVVVLLAFVYPKEGIEVGGVTLKFADAEEVLAPDEEPAYDASGDADKIRRYIAAQQMNEDMKRRYAVLNRPGVIAFPGDMPEWMDGVFAALDNARREPVRILHYGDSQIEEDRITGRMRTDIQELFGGYGAGMVPAYQSVPTSAVGQKCDVELPRSLVYGTPEQKHPQRNYGPSGQMATLDGTATTSFYRINLKSTGDNTKMFSLLTVMLANDSIDVEISLNADGYSDRKTVPAGGGMKFVSFRLPDSTVRAAVTISGAAELYGYMLDSKEGGVAVDNIPMRGCSGTVFTGMGRSTLEPFFSSYRVPLIILQYGGNSVPYLKKGEAVGGYCASLRRQIAYLRSVAPQSRILFIGPSDMTTKEGGKLATYPVLPELNDSLRTMCLSCDVAYWDMFRAMGGEGAMQRWVESDPPLAGADYVHFTPLGSQKIGDMLFDAIKSAYDYYLYRQENGSDYVPPAPDTADSIPESIM